MTLKKNLAAATLRRMAPVGCCTKNIIIGCFPMAMTSGSLWGRRQRMRSTCCTTRSSAPRQNKSCPMRLCPISAAIHQSDQVCVSSFSQSQRCSCLHRSTHTTVRQCLRSPGQFGRCPPESSALSGVCFVFCSSTAPLWRAIARTRSVSMMRGAFDAHRINAIANENVDVM